MKNSTNNKKILFSISLLIFFLLIETTSCQSELISNTPIPIVQEVPVILTDTILSMTPPAPVLVTVIRQPIESLVSATAPLTPSPMPIPTLSLAEKKVITNELYLTNANCEFPCWWGITPGETEWQTAKSFLNTLATGISSESDSLFVAEVDMPVSEEHSEINFLRQSFFIQDDVIEIIEPALSRSMQSTIISEILSTYGRPQEVWIDTFGYSLGEVVPFRLVLFYPEKGILVRYFDDADFQNDHVIGCFTGHSGAIVLWAPELELTFAEALNGTNALGTYGEQYYKPLDKATDMDLETFYQTFLDPNTDVCIETPAELWMDK
jgi:hypothetical protein